MIEQRKNIRHLASIKLIRETYQDHPSMQRVNAFKEQLKQQKLEDKAFCQSIKEKRAVREP